MAEERITDNRTCATCGHPFVEHARNADTNQRTVCMHNCPCERFTPVSEEPSGIKDFYDAFAHLAHPAESPKDAVKDEPPPCPYGEDADCQFHSHPAPVKDEGFDAEFERLYAEINESEPIGAELFDVHDLRKMFEAGAAWAARRSIPPMDRETIRAAVARAHKYTAHNSRIDAFIDAIADELSQLTRGE